MMWTNQSAVRFKQKLIRCPVKRPPLVRAGIQVGVDLFSTNKQGNISPGPVKLYEDFFPGFRCDLAHETQCLQFDSPAERPYV